MGSHSDRVKVSFVTVTYNRREAILKNLERLESTTELPRDKWEMWLVDNGSTDQTARWVSSKFCWANLIVRPTNEGMPGRNHAIRKSTGEYVVFLDDYVYPLPGALPKALEYLDAHPNVAAITARVRLPNGSEDGPALPTVLLGGASIVRRRVLEEVGGIPEEFFRQAEEYDLSMRIWDAGYRIERFEDIQFLREKIPVHKRSALVHRMDMRNNLIVASRYLPKSLRREIRADWALRYGALAQKDGQAAAAWRGRMEAVYWRVRERLIGNGPVEQSTIDDVFGARQQFNLVRAWKERNQLQRVVIADFGKNLLSTYRACLGCGLEVVAIWDKNPAYQGIRYRGAPVVSDLAGLRCADGVVLSNVNPAQIERVWARVNADFSGPTLRLWEPKWLTEVAEHSADVAANGPAPSVRSSR